ncbi:hypothetical protein WMY93_003481 [Mugilogobius chulae]|uniref:Glycosyltransferase 2-like domain-containing protein n=1 Tax=Mugilogobius chulae TaxID=88201 RepID=A0AAW0PYC1_9GOBI
MHILIELQLLSPFSPLAYRSRRDGSQKLGPAHYVRSGVGVLVRDVRTGTGHNVAPAQSALPRECEIDKHSTEMLSSSGQSRALTDLPLLLMLEGTSRRLMPRRYTNPAIHDTAVSLSRAGVEAYLRTRARKREAETNLIPSSMDGAPDSLHQSSTQRYGRYASTRCWRQAAAAGEEERHVFFIGGQSGGKEALEPCSARLQHGPEAPSSPRTSPGPDRDAPGIRGSWSHGATLASPWEESGRRGGLIPVLCCQQEAEETDVVSVLGEKRVSHLPYPRCSTPEGDNLRAGDAEEDTSSFQLPCFIKMNRPTNIKMILGILFMSMFGLVLLYTNSGAIALPTTQKGLSVTFKNRPTLVSSRNCTCQPGSMLLKDYIPADKRASIFQRRKEELQKYKSRTSSELRKLLLAPPNSPLQYPIQGFTVPPLKSSLIPGLAVHAQEQSSYKVILKVGKGILSTDVSHFKDKVTVTGNKEAELTVESTNLSVLNDVLASILYQSKTYHVHTGDLAQFIFDNHQAVFPIVIKQPQVPVLFDMGTDINSQVTIAIKTFLRYDCLQVLLNSIRKFYPKITVIIADDSLKPQKIEGENIQQFIMPPAQGWFAGRNLAVSQVTTKYFLWADDDFVFNENTKIEKLVEIMEAVPELDVLGGSVEGNRFYFSLEYEEGGSEGGCLSRTSSGRFSELPGFPQCNFASGVVNFFLARTDSIQKSRFDPLLKRVAHSEWFMDGLGSLMVASCGHVSIGHQPKKSFGEYGKFRAPATADTNFKLQLHYFKNHLKCIKYG